MRENGNAWPACGSAEARSHGRDRRGGSSSGVAPTGALHRAHCDAYSGYRFPPEIIALAVRSYLRYRLSYADVVELLAERGAHVDPSTL